MMQSYKSKGLYQALFLFFSLLALSLTSCAGRPPLLDQATAVEAQRYAKKNYALKYAPNYYRRGDAVINSAHRYFEERVYKKAQKAYRYARLLFEKAETKARVLQIKEGGEF